VDAPSLVGTIALMLVVGLACDLVSGWVRLPRALLLIAAGVALGPSGTGSLELPPGSSGVRLVLTLGVALLLFSGGLGLDLAVIRRVWPTLAMLAVPGVPVTPVLTGWAAVLAFGLPLASGLLVGAVVAPTDPAVLVSLFDRLRVRPKVAQTIVAESALNDPSGAALAVTLAAAVLGNGSLGSSLGRFALDLLVSTVLGVAIGLLLGITVSDRRFGIWRESPALAVLAVVAAGYVGVDVVGGSGYLGAFLAGLVAGNLPAIGLGMHPEHERDMRSFVSATTDVVGIAVFLVLGANLQFGAFGRYALPALVVTAALVLVARPATVALCLLPDRRAAWTTRELAFFAWTRETGVVAAAVAGVLVAQGVPFAAQLETVVTVAIVVTLVLQAAAKPWLARRLGLTEGTDQPARAPATPAGPAAAG